MNDALAVLQPSFTGPELPEWFANLLREGLGGVCLFGFNVESREQLAALNAQIHDASATAVVAIDEEGGDVTRLYQSVGSPFPGNAVLGRIDDLVLTRAVAEQVGWELRAAGVDLTLAPDVDVNSNPLNPVIGFRAFGAEPALVARHTAAWIAGVQSTGVAACAKHFPGHGDTAQDSHLALPVVDADVALLRERDLPPFASAIAAGVRSIMTSHIVVPALDDKPATFSGEILAGVLRDSMGFDGVVVTDALDMVGASGDRGIPAAAVDSLVAGADFLCIGPDNSEQQVRDIAAAIDAAVASGELPAARLVDAARRVRRLGAQAANARTTLAVPETHVPGAVAGLELAIVSESFDISPEALALLETRSRPDIAWLRIETPQNIAVGVSPWGPFATGEIAAAATLTPGDDIDKWLAAAGGALPVIVGIDNHRHAASRAAIDAARAHGPVVVVDMGWAAPDRAYADIATFGASRVVGAAPYRQDCVMTSHLGLDIGGTKTEAVVTDEHGVVIATHRVDSGRGAAGVVGAALLAAEHACAAAGTNAGFVDSAGVGIPGAISNGEVRHAINLGIERFALADTLAGYWGKRPVVENDVNAAAVGAWVLAGDGPRSMAYLNLGTGLAAGIVIDGRLWRGARGAAGEIGHVSVDPGGPTGPDGLPGGLEAYAGGVGIAMASGDGRTAAEILADPHSDDARNALYFGVASAIRILVLTLDVEEVVIGGGVTRLQASLVDGVRSKLDAWAADSAFLDSVDLPSRFRLLDSEQPVAAIGAAMIGAGRG